MNNRTTKQQATRHTKRTFIRSHEKKQSIDSIETTDVIGVVIGVVIGADVVHIVHIVEIQTHHGHVQSRHHILDI